MGQINTFSLSKMVAIVAIATVLTASIALAENESVADREQPTPDQLRFFETSIRPLLADHCYECHGAEVQESDLRVDSLRGMLAGGKAGASLVPGKPSSSLMLTAVSYHDSELRMPPDQKLSDAQIADLTRWIDMGAPHPDGGSMTNNRREPRPLAPVDIEQGRKHWAFQSPVKPKPPQVDSALLAADHADAISNSIDQFILAAQQEKQIRPLGRADKRKLIRRASYDLIGLPPTVAEIDAFLTDESQDAFTRVVDRLLESPHYGERWGRHWLDIARYADSNGLDENIAHGNAWRYRDYVIQSLCDDKPYDEFIVEQLAGDLLDSGNDVALRNERMIATGFLVLGPKVLAEVDESKMEMDIVDEQIDTIGRSLLGLTLGCARCHSHKFDPIGHDDYYALAGIFKSTRTMDSFTKIAKWHENSIALPEDIERNEAHEQRIAQKQRQIDDRIAAATEELTKRSDGRQGSTETPQPDDKKTAEQIEQQFPESTRAELEKLRAELKQLNASAPKMPTAMGVIDGSVTDTEVHLRGSHLTLGEVVQRRFPLVLAGRDQPELPTQQSGRLEFARWLTSGRHPLTARVMVNRIWRGHFGKGLVTTMDNFGLQGAAPTHPRLLDWLAVRFVEEGWSIKAMHRLIMSSATYQRDSSFDVQRAQVDPDNRLYWRFDVRRLEAEAIRDSLLAVAGTLDRSVGGSLLKTENRAFLFDHTSIDASSYDTLRRSVYIPVIRNHLYDLFQLFDYTDASVLNGDRDSSTIAPQALFLMNSDWVMELTLAMADRFMNAEGSQSACIDRLFLEVYARPASGDERVRAEQFLSQFQTLEAGGKDTDAYRAAWQALCQSVVSSSEFIYVQ